ncbi:hypothetical protein KIPB_008193, partial [Kipferlia bialata]
VRQIRDNQFGIEDDLFYSLVLSLIAKTSLLINTVTLAEDEVLREQDRNSERGVPPTSSLTAVAILQFLSLYVPELRPAVSLVRITSRTQPQAIHAYASGRAASVPVPDSLTNITRGPSHAQKGDRDRERERERDSGRRGERDREEPRLRVLILDMVDTGSADVQAAVADLIQTNDPEYLTFSPSTSPVVVIGIAGVRLTKQAPQPLGLLCPSLARAFHAGVLPLVGVRPTPHIVTTGAPPKTLRELRRLCSHAKRVQVHPDIKGFIRDVCAYVNNCSAGAVINQTFVPGLAACAGTYEQIVTTARCLASIRGRQRRSGTSGVTSATPDDARLACLLVLPHRVHQLVLGVVNADTDSVETRFGQGERGVTKVAVEALNRLSLTSLDMVRTAVQGVQYPV